MSKPLPEDISERGPGMNLYAHAEMISVRVNQDPLRVCVSRVPVGRGGERLVMLHGNPASMHDFGPLAGLLGEAFEVVAIDLPGFGRSGNVLPVAHESLLDTYARHVLAVLDAIGWGGACFVLGHSHGAAVAQAIAALCPERVRGLILLGSVGSPAHWGYRQLVLPGVMSALRVLARTLNYVIPRPVRRRIVREVMRPIFAPAPLAAQWVEEQLAVVEARPEILVNMALVASGDPCGQLARAAAQIRAPVLFIHGDSDRLVPEAHARAIYETVSRFGTAEFHVFPRTGHMLHITHPRAIRDRVVTWIATLPSDRAAAS